MSKNDVATRSRILSCLVEGMGVRPTARCVGVSVNAVQRLIRAVGRACQRFHDEQVYGLPCSSFEADEQWAFCYAREKNVPEELKGTFGFGDVWLFQTICKKTKIVPAWRVDERTGATAADVLVDLAKRLLTERFALDTDGFQGYFDATGAVYSRVGKWVDWARVIKSFATPNGQWNSKENRYEQPGVKSVRRLIGMGQPDVDNASTSYSERLNLGTRQHCRKMARLTNGHAKKLEMLRRSVAIHFTFYNWCKPHEALKGMTPAMANGLAKKRMTAEDLIRVADAYAAEERAFWRAQRFGS